MSDQTVPYVDPEFPDRRYLVPKDIFDAAVVWGHSKRPMPPMLQRILDIAAARGVQLIAIENPNHTGVDATLHERGTRYGDFATHARICQNMICGWRLEDGWGRLDPVQRQALTVIADKIARVLSGDPDYEDNWHDLQGYARLVENWLKSGKKTCL